MTKLAKIITLLLVLFVSDHEADEFRLAGCATGKPQGSVVYRFYEITMGKVLQRNRNLYPIL